MRLRRRWTRGQVEFADGLMVPETEEKVEVEFADELIVLEIEEKVEVEFEFADGLTVLETDRW
jgi:hypothetical protein